MVEENIRIIDDRVYELTGTCDPTVCDAWCCRHVQFLIDKVNDDDKAFFERHGFIVLDEGAQLRILADADCRNLDTLMLRCKEYDRRPSACRLFADRNDLHFRPPDCTLRWHELHGRRADVILSRRLKE